MRNAIENVSILQKQINDLQIENQILKELLGKSGISYVDELRKMKIVDSYDEYDNNQGERIIHPKEITEEMANFFYSRFWGRQDVFAKRYENKNTKEAGYFTQCNNFWKDVCSKKGKQKINCKDCKYRSYKQLTINDILWHLRG